jgi:hypothetical protein
VANMGDPIRGNGFLNMIRNYLEGGGVQGARVGLGGARDTLRMMKQENHDPELIRRANEMIAAAVKLISESQSHRPHR